MSLINDGPGATPATASKPPRFPAWTGGKVFGIGLGKTGTTSLAAAMQMIGFRVKHSPRNVDDIEKFDFVNDISVACRFRFLDFVFPDARFILTIRDIPSWLASCETHASHRTQRGPLRRIESRFLLFGRVDFEKDVFAAACKRHTDDVEAHFADRPGKLLIMDVCAGDGWNLLCPFLGVLPPSGAFPHHNKGTVPS